MSHWHWKDETPECCDICECGLCDQDEWIEVDGNIWCETCAVKQIAQDLDCAFDIIFYGQGMMQ